MPEVGEITVISSSPKTVYWKIDNFFALPKDVSYAIGSPRFTFDESSWRLLAFPNGTRELPGCTILMLSAPAKYTRTVHWELGIYRQDGTLLKRSCGVRCYQGEKYSDDKSLLIMYEVLKKACFFPNGYLTAVCKLYSEKEGITETEASSQTETISRTDKLANDLKGLLLSGDNSDVTIRVKGEVFKVHRSILGARTPVFDCMFKHQMSENTTGIVDIDDCEAGVFRTFLHYVYTGTVDKLCPENIFGLYEMADKYQVDELKPDCLECMKNTLSIDTICDVIAVAVRHDEQELLEMTTDFLSKNTTDVMATLKWQDLLSDNPIEANNLLLEALRRQK